MKSRTMTVGLCMACVFVWSGVSTSVGDKALASTPIDRALQQIGTWDGQTATKTISNYADPRQAELPFGMLSYYLAPWRAYVDTWDASRYYDTLGVNFNVPANEATATAKVLADAGIRSARLEIAWNSLSYANPSQLNSSALQSFTTILKSLQKVHIRPLILLNSNSGAPCPNMPVHVALEQSAPQGATTIVVDKADLASIVPKYTGINDNQAAMTAFPMITNVDPNTGDCTLSAPLTTAIPAGPLQLELLKYQPFSPPTFADGTPNPASQQTYDGWLNYVKTVTNYVKQTIGSDQFDIEVWNELSFGSQFLDINNYYNPKLQFGPPYTYVGRYGQPTQGSQSILNMTADYVRNPSNHLPAVHVIDGFSNQRPWENGTQLYQGLSGFSRHYYTQYTPDNVYTSTTPASKTQFPLVNVLGQTEGGPTPATSGAKFVPIHTVNMPEYWFYGYQTESIVRDLQPFPAPLLGHFRYANPGNGHAAQVWETETNFWRLPFAQQLTTETGVPLSSSVMNRIMEYVGTKTTLRTYLFSSNKGVHTVELFAAKSADAQFALISPRFFTALDANHGRLTPAIERLAGPQIAALIHVNKIMQSGLRIAVPRAVGVKSVVDYKPRLVFQGDGTPAHPSYYDVNDFAVLPTQLSNHRFAIAYYVVTRDVTHSYNTQKHLLNPARYAMPPETFDVTLSNIQGEGARVTSYDPMTNTTVPVQVVASTASSITIRVESVDYPRFILLDEAVAGPQILNPTIGHTSHESVLSFTPNTAGVVHLTWGGYPNRTDGQWLAQYFDDANFGHLALVEHENAVDLTSLTVPLAANHDLSVRWNAVIRPSKTDNYTFIADTNGYSKVMLDGKAVLDQSARYLTGEVKSTPVHLVGGQKYRVEVDYRAVAAQQSVPGTPDMELYWMTNTRYRESVPAAPDKKQSVVLTVKGGKRVNVPLTNFHYLDGVRIDFSNGHVTDQFPHWDYDVTGVDWNRSDAVQPINGYAYGYAQFQHSVAMHHDQQALLYADEIGTDPQATPTLAHTVQSIATTLLQTADAEFSSNAADAGTIYQAVSGATAVAAPTRALAQADISALASYRQAQQFAYNHDFYHAIQALDYANSALWNQKQGVHTFLLHVATGLQLAAHVETSRNQQGWDYEYLVNWYDKYGNIPEYFKTDATYQLYLLNHTPSDIVLNLAQNYRTNADQFSIVGNVTSNAGAAGSQVQRLIINGVTESVYAPFAQTVPLSFGLNQIPLTEDYRNGNVSAYTVDVYRNFVAVSSNVGEYVEAPVQTTLKSVSLQGKLMAPGVSTLLLNGQPIQPQFDQTVNLHEGINAFEFQGYDAKHQELFDEVYYVRRT